MLIRTLPIGLNSNDWVNMPAVALDMQGKAINTEKIQARLHRWKDAVGKLDGRYIAVYHNNSLDFICILSALWQVGKLPVVPGNLLSSTMQSITRICDNSVGEIPGEHAWNGAGFDEIPEDLALIMFTSGSSGEPKPVFKTFAQLNAEMQMLESHWGDRVADAAFAGTVSHHHMYGLPFRLFWPWVTGRPFFEQAFSFWEQLESLGEQKIVFVTSPVHLEHIPENIDWDATGISIPLLLSAGAVLPRKTGKEVAAKMGIGVTEIYGSTETGAVAWRQGGSDQVWAPFTGVRIASENGLLKIQLVLADPDNWLSTQDKCEITENGGFNLKGRADRIAKIGGKRVSLTQIESGLTAHPWVEQAKVAVLPSRKSRVGALVKLTQNGCKNLIDLGNQAVNRELSSALDGSIEIVARPRYWRYMSALPSNSEGKLSQQEFEQQFELEKRPLKPDVLTHQIIPDTREHILDLKISENLYYFEGHFPGQPVLPGVVQISWAIEFGMEFFGELGSFQALEVVKFQRVIQPRDRVSLQLRWDERKQKLFFKYVGVESDYSSGRIAFGRSDL